MTTPACWQPSNDQRQPRGRLLLRTPPSWAGRWECTAAKSSFRPTSGRSTIRFRFSGSGTPAAPGWLDVLSLDAVGQIFHAMTMASGKVPQISIVLGFAAGGAAYGPALTDVVILAPEGRIFVTGPDVVRSVTGEDVDMLRLGGPDTHGRRSGVVHIVADDESTPSSRADRWPPSWPARAPPNDRWPMPTWRPCCRSRRGALTTCTR